MKQYLKQMQTDTQKLNRRLAKMMPDGIKADVLSFEVGSDKAQATLEIECRHLDDSKRWTYVSFRTGQTDAEIRELMSGAIAELTEKKASAEKAWLEKGNLIDDDGGPIGVYSIRYFGPGGWTSDTEQTGLGHVSRLMEARLDYGHGICARCMSQPGRILIASDEAAMEAMKRRLSEI